MKHPSKPTYRTEDVVLINFTFDSRQSFDDHPEDGDEDEELITPRVHGRQLVVLRFTQDNPQILSRTFYSTPPSGREYSSL